MGESVLDSLAAKITGIISPVTICMALTVWLVRTLDPGGASSSSAVAIANIYYHEEVGHLTFTLLWWTIASLHSIAYAANGALLWVCMMAPRPYIKLNAEGRPLQDSDSAGIKIQGAVINATIFVVFVGLMTFALVLLFKYGVRLQSDTSQGYCQTSSILRCACMQYSNIIWGYMGFAGFSIFFVLGGTLTVQLIQLYRIPVDIVSFLFLLYNLSASSCSSWSFIKCALSTFEMKDLVWEHHVGCVRPLACHPGSNADAQM